MRKNTIRLTESELITLVSRIINEDEVKKAGKAIAKVSGVKAGIKAGAKMNFGDWAKKAAAAAKESGKEDDKSIMSWVKNAVQKAQEQAAGSSQKTVKGLAKVASNMDSSWYDKVVQKAKEELNESELEEGFLGDKIGWVMDAAKNVADMFTKEYIDTGKMPKKEIEDLAAKAEGALPSEDEEEEVDVEVETISEMKRIPSSNVLLNEGLIFEGKVRDKVMRLLNKAGILGGLGITLGGFASFVSNIPGYVDSAFLTKVHEMIENTFNCGFACGALGFLAMVIGIAIAIFNAARGHKRRPGSLGESRRRRRVIREAQMGNISWTDAKGKEHIFKTVEDILRAEKKLGLGKFELFRKLGPEMTQRFGDKQGFASLLKIIQKIK